MWVKKTDKELMITNSGQPSGKVRLFLYLLIGVFLMIPVFFNFGRLVWRPGPFFRPMDDVMLRLPAMVFIYLIVIIPMWFLKVPILKKKKVMICPKCEAAKNNDEDYECPCGGRFVELETMKWQEKKAP